MDVISFELFHPQKHYETAAQWWKVQGWDVLPLTHLSQTGIVVNLNNVAAAMCWIYKTDSAFCLIEWIVADPSVRKQARSDVLNALISKTKEIAKEMGFQTAFMNARSESLISRLKKHNFVVADSDTKNLTCNLRG